MRSLSVGRHLKKLCFVAFCSLLCFTTVHFTSRFLFSALKSNTRAAAQQSTNPSAKDSKLADIEIWGIDAPIGEYLWNHIVGGKKVYLPDGETRVGNKVVNALNFTYITGPQSIFSNRQLPANVVLVFDVSSDSKQAEMQEFMARFKNQSNLKNAVAVLKSETHCKNNSYVTNRYFLEQTITLFNATFLIHANYSSESVFPWPNGVDTKNEFPLFTPDDADILPARIYYCNLIVSDEAKSAFAPLISQLDECGEKCRVKYITKSDIAEDPLDALGEKIQALSDSDLTLCPATSSESETSIIYEALSLGSVPVIEDNQETGCSDLRNTIALLKRHRAPVMFVHSLSTELTCILDKERAMTEQEKIVRRASVITWYFEFRKNTANVFASVVQSCVSIKTTK